MVNKMIVQHLKKLANVETVFSLFKTKNDDNDTFMDILQGNGHLFVLANLLEFIRETSDTPAAVDRMVQLTNYLGNRCRAHISDRQISKYKHYHPLFKWSCSNWGNSIDVVVYERVQAQLEYLWSRSFVDLVFANVLDFDSTKLSGGAAAASKDGLKTRLFKKKNQPTLLDSKDYAHVVELSMNVESIFAMYMLLITLFPTQRMEIINKIAFTTRLIPQLWRAMNTFGPRGHMSIYLDAARRQDGHVEKEPLIKVLQMFCEAASLVFLTLDDTDIFEHETPFSTQDLIDLSTFLNTFYFALLQHAKSEQQNDAAVVAASIRAFRAAHRLLLQIYDLDMRHPFCPEGHWLLVSDPTIKQSILSLFNTSKPPAAASFLDRFRQGDPVPLRILQLMPHTIPFETRLTIFRDWIAHDRANTMRTGHCSIRVRRKHILEDGIRGLGGIPPAAWKGVIRVTFVNELGVEEAGIDHGGPFKDFVSLLVNQVFEPSFGLFATTSSTHLVYPSPTSSIHGKGHIRLFEFIGKVIGKAIYEGILSDIQFASFLLAKLLGRNVFLQELRELDEDVWRNLIFLKRYDGCVEDLGLYFATDEEAFGQVTTHELKYRGKNMPVTNENKIEYVYRMADYKLNQQTREQTRAFVDGFRSIITEGWIKVFSPPELQRVISGEDTDFDVADLRQHTEYHNGYFDQHPIIRSLWQIIQEFNSDEKRAFLKFVTSCSKPPLGGFSYLYPPFTIRMVTVDPDARQGTVDGLGMVKTLFKIGNGSTNKGGRLPTASTCFNLLKLPAYTKKSLLREKLRYAIHANTGFELS
ncbi:HECT-domain-containing protein [Lichtheimia hyalospora FSU 10163]|nr:HECT-domain-containing protein [Lichtheimia hyalospora FSU 10163]